MTKAPTALVVLSDSACREAISQSLSACGIQPITCSTLREAQAISNSEPANVVFCEISFADGSFDDLLCALGSGEPGPPVIVCSRLYDPVLYLDLMIAERLTLSCTRIAPRRCDGFW
jgi:DNA-binding NtrC family response regulator